MRRIQGAATATASPFRGLIQSRSRFPGRIRCHRPSRIRCHRHCPIRPRTAEEGARAVRETPAGKVEGEVKQVAREAEAARLDHARRCHFHFRCRWHCHGCPTRSIRRRHSIRSRLIQRCLIQSRYPSRSPSRYPSRCPNCRSHCRSSNRRSRSHSSRAPARLRSTRIRCRCPSSRSSRMPNPWLPASAQPTIPLRPSPYLSLPEESRSRVRGAWIRARRRCPRNRNRFGRSSRRPRRRRTTRRAGPRASPAVGHGPSPGSASPSAQPARSGAPDDLRACVPPRQARGGSEACAPPVARRRNARRTGEAGQARVARAPGTARRAHRASAAGRARKRAARGRAADVEEDRQPRPRPLGGGARRVESRSCLGEKPQCHSQPGRMTHPGVPQRGASARGGAYPPDSLKP